jgi:hypothetical protein
MKTANQRSEDLIDVLKNCDIAYAFKKKRLRYIRSATVNKEILHLRDTFYSLWFEEDGLYRLKDPLISKKSIEIILEIFGKSDEASALFDINSSLASIDRVQFEEFIEAHVASRKAKINLTTIFFGKNGSIHEYVRRQNIFIVRVISTMKKFDIDDLASLRINEHDKESIIEIISHLDEIEKNLSRDIRLFGVFMRDFKRLFRESAEVDIVGYGEISTVMRLRKKGWISEDIDIINDDSRWIWKKMPPFPGKEDVDTYEKLYGEYWNILTERIGIHVPRQMARHFRHDDYYIVYAGQEKLDERHVCNVLIKKWDARNAGMLLRMILQLLYKVHTFNQSDPHIAIGIDAQLSNWVLAAHHEAEMTVHEDDTLLYIDTSLPLIRIDGEEQTNTELFIKSAASFLRPIIRAFFLQEVVDRYYNIRSVIIDLIANLYKEKRTDLIDDFLNITNEYCDSSGFGFEPLCRKEIDAYYSNDAFIWKFYQASRKIDRFITEHIFRKKYLFHIPGIIER